nr:NADH dehydrogenase subunit 6 [Dichoptera sp. WW-2021a]
MKSMMISNMIISMMMKHPLSMGTMIISQTILMCINQNNLTKNSWYLYILFITTIVFITTIGGLMVMFMYMASIASNEMFSPKLKLMILWTIMFISSMYMMKYNNEKSPQEMKLIFNELSEQKSTSKFFNLFKMNITIMMMMTLMITMISVTNISSTFEGPLKKL